MKTIAIIDIGSFVLPYDFYYVRELIRQNYKIDFYCSKTKYNDFYINELKMLGVKVFEFKISSSVSNKIMALFEYMRFVKTLLSLYNTYDYIHFMWSAIPYVDLFLFFILKKKLVFTFHNHVPHNKDKKYFPYLFIFKLARKRVFVSNFTRDIFFKIYNLNHEKNVYVFNHGILPFNLNENYFVKSVKFEKRLVFWGNVKKYKGIDFLLNILEDNRFNGWKLEIYGKWEKSLYNVKNVLSKYENVYIEDSFLSLERLLDILSRDCVFVLPYNKATQSGVLYTLLNYCKVFISTNKGDNGEFLCKNNLRELVFYDKDTFFNALKYAEKYYIDLVNQMCKIKKKYKWEITMKNIRKLYDK